MKGVTRIVLVDPHEETRTSLQRLISGIDSVWLSEVCINYETASRSILDNPPDLAIVVLDGDPDQALSSIQAITSGKPGLVVLAASKVRDTEAILRVVRAGAREFLTLPVDIDEILGAIDRFVRPLKPHNDKSRNIPHVIAVAGAAGGVGCTTLAVNLAAILARNSSQSVVIADFDLLLGSVDTCLDIIPDRTILDVAMNIDRLDLTLLKRSTTRHSSGLYVLPHPVMLEDAVKIEADSLRRMIKLLRAVFNTVIIDTSKGLQASDFVAMEMADVILLVVQLDLICLRNTSRLMQLLTHSGMPPEKIQIVINRQGSSVSEITLKKVEETLGTTIRWQIPNATKVISEARVRGVPIDEESPGNRVHRVIADIAREFRVPDSDKESSPVRKKGIFAALF